MSSSGKTHRLANVKKQGLKKKRGVSEEQKSISWNKVSKETMGRNAVGKGRQCPALYVLMGPGGLRQD